MLFDELVDTRVVNGFAIAPVPSPLTAAIRFNAELQTFRFLRMAETFGIAEAKQLSAGGAEVRGPEAADRADVRRLPREAHEADREDGRRGALAEGRRPVRAQVVGIARLDKAVAGGSADAISPAHLCFLSGLDAFLTMLQLDRGDPASVLHNVEWQRDLFTEVDALAKLDGAKDLVKLSDKFIRDWEARKAGPDQFAAFVKRAAPILRRVAAAAPRLPLARSLDDLEKSLGSAGDAQLAHRDVLLRLAALRR